MKRLFIALLCAAVGAPADEPPRAWLAACSRLPDDARVLVDFVGDPITPLDELAERLGIVLAAAPPPEADATARLERARFEGATHCLVLFTEAQTGPFAYCRETDAGRHLAGRYRVLDAGLRHVLFDFGLPTVTADERSELGLVAPLVRADLATIGVGRPSWEGLVPGDARLAQALASGTYGVQGYAAGFALLARDRTSRFSATSAVRLEPVLAGRHAFPPAALRVPIGRVAPRPGAPFEEAVALRVEDDEPGWTAIATIGPLAAGRYECLYDAVAVRAASGTPLFDLLAYESGTTRVLAYRRIEQATSAGPTRWTVPLLLEQSTTIDLNCYFLDRADLDLLACAVLPAVDGMDRLDAMDWMDTKQGWPGDATVVLDLPTLGRRPCGSREELETAFRLLQRPDVRVEAITRGKALLVAGPRNENATRVRELVPWRADAGPADWRILAGRVRGLPTAPAGAVLDFDAQETPDGLSLVWPVGLVEPGRYTLEAEWRAQSPPTRLPLHDLAAYRAGAGEPLVERRFFAEDPPGSATACAIPLDVSQPIPLDVTLAYRRGADLSLRRIGLVREGDAFQRRSAGPREWDILYGELRDATDAPANAVLSLDGRRDPDGFAALWQAGRLPPGRYLLLADWQLRSEPTNRVVFDFHVYTAGATEPFAARRVLGTLAPGALDRAECPFEVTQTARIQFAALYRRGADADLNLLSVLPDVSFVPLTLNVEAERLAAAGEAVAVRDLRASERRALRLAGTARPPAPALAWPLGAWPAGRYRWAARLAAERQSRDGVVLWWDLWDDGEQHLAAWTAAAERTSATGFAPAEWEVTLLERAPLTLTLDHNARVPVRVDGFRVEMTDP